MQEIAGSGPNACGRLTERPPPDWGDGRCVIRTAVRATVRRLKGYSKFSQQGSIETAQSS
jgi:hypothetical protein